MWFDVELPRTSSELAWPRSRAAGSCGSALPDLDCLEYLFDVDGAMAPDPGNPDQVEGAFGPHSWLAMPGYRPPAWLDQRSAHGHAAPADGGRDRRRGLGAGRHEDAPLPLLLVHDGAEMDAYGGVVRYAATRPPMRVGLLSPGSDRDERYAANPAYAAALVGEVIPALTRRRPDDVRAGAPRAEPRGLAALHAAWLYPDAFAGLVLQSGSFFTPVLDPQESGYAQFDQVVGFVALAARVDRGAARGSRRWPSPAGLAEENLANNRAHAHPPRRPRGPGHVGRGAPGPHVDVLARHPRPAPRRPAHEGVA